MSKDTQVAVIGAGSVGVSISYGLLLRRICSKLILVDIDTKRLNGEILDLTDGAYLSNTIVRAGTIQKAGQCDVIVISAGAKQREGESRKSLIDRNYTILKSVIDGMKPFNSRAIIVVVANPCDALTFFAQQLVAGELPRSQVFGSGTFLDSAQLRTEIATKLGVAHAAVHAYVMGEHGDSQFVPWSVAHVGGLPLLNMPEFQDSQYLHRLAEQTKNKAYEIIGLKGATYFGIAAIVSSIVEFVFWDTKDVRLLSSYLPDYNCCMSVPAVIGRQGIQRVLPLYLNPQELNKLRASADCIKKIINARLAHAYLPQKGKPRWLNRISYNATFSAGLRAKAQALREGREQMPNMLSFR